MSLGEEPWLGAMLVELRRLIVYRTKKTEKSERSKKVGKRRERKKNKRGRFYLTPLCLFTQGIDDFNAR